MTLRELARWYDKRLKTKTRDSGKEYLVFDCEDKQEEERCRALAMAAHDNGNILPDDFRYVFISEALSALSETNDPDDITIEADVYTSDLTAWLNSRNDRYSYCDSAISEGIVSDSASMIDRLQAGQYLEQCEVVTQIRAYLETELEELNEESEELSQ